MNEGDRIEITIRDVALGGDGVGRVDDLVIFVPFAVDGDRLNVRITGLKKKFARGEITEILAPSPHRIVPACPHFAHCGGCRYQHISYPHQLELKERQVRETFARIGKLPLPPPVPVKPSPRIFHYRGKAEYHISRSGAVAAVGFMDITGGRVVDIGECLIVDDSINRACEEFRRSLTADAEKFPGDRLTLWSGEEGGGACRHSPATPSSVTRSVGSRRFLVPSGGFFQANSALTETLAHQVAALCALTGRETLLDCYCGSGLFALFVLPRVGRIFGIEGDKDAARCAAINMGEEGEGKARFFAGDVARVLKREFVQGGTAADVVILDPPRTGCSRKVLDALAALRPARIVYVSCNPATQARDSAYLARRGFTLKDLQPVDMFPQTGHIEVVGLLERRNG